MFPIKPHQESLIEHSIVPGVVEQAFSFFPDLLGSGFGLRLSPYPLSTFEAYSFRPLIFCSCLFLLGFAELVSFVEGVKGSYYLLAF